MLAEQLIEHRLGNLIDLPDGLFLDGHQIGIGQIGELATLREFLHNEAGDLLDRRSVFGRIHGITLKTRFLNFPANPAAPPPF